MNMPSEARPAHSGTVDAALADFVAATHHLPLYPAVAAQLVRSVENEDISGPELARQIAADAALATHLLRLVNSSFYGMSRRIGTVSDALSVLGFNMVRRIVTAVVMRRPMLAYLPDTAASRDFWRHQLLCAVLARHLHQHQGDDGAEVAYMAGLLHDVGRLAMFARWPRAYAATLLRPSLPTAADDDLIAVERSSFGFDHAQAGGALLAHWGVPEAICEAAAGHRNALVPEAEVPAHVWHANGLSHRISAQQDCATQTLWMTEAGLDPLSVRRFLDEVAAFTGGRG
jgi:HD-like signal output (HDOD) protein